MAKTLRDALVRAGLVRVDQAQALEAQERPEPLPPAHAFDRSGKPYKFPKNREGHRPHWVRWYLEQHVPFDAHIRCCECGYPRTASLVPHDLAFVAAFYGDSETMHTLFTGVPTKICILCLNWILSGNR